MYESALPRVLKFYGIEYQRIFDFQKGYRNEIWPVLTSDNRMLNVTFYKREAEIVNRIARADKVSAFVAGHGLPARQRFDNRTLMLKSENITTYIGVYDYLPGQTIPWESYTMEKIKTLGATMSNMHFILSAGPLVALPSVYDEYIEIVGRMKQYFLQLTVADAVARKLNLIVSLDRFDDYINLLELYKTKSGQQPLHMDFVRGNILFDGDAISGILDFEKTALGHPVMDISRTLAFLMVDCKYKTIDKVVKYFLHSGYQKRGKNKDIGDDADRNKLVEMFLMYDFYKFLRHNPYESLSLNQHYVRTADILAKRGVIFYK